LVNYHLVCSDGMEHANFLDEWNLHTLPLHIFSCKIWIMFKKSKDWIWQYLESVTWWCLIIQPHFFIQKHFLCSKVMVILLQAVRKSSVDSIFFNKRVMLLCFQWPWKFWYKTEKHYCVMIHILILLLLSWSVYSGLPSHQLTS
jgi:hypothetical protein